VTKHFDSPRRVYGWALWLSVSVLSSLANAQGLPNPTMAPNLLTTTISIFRSNMQDKIMKSADEMPESKYSYRPTKDVRSFTEILNHVADVSYTLCSNVKGEATPPRLPRRVRRPRSWPTSKARSITDHTVGMVPTSTCTSFA
jgi:hypothetical protein